MKPIVLCIIDKLNLEQINNYSKVFLNPSDNIYSDIGLGKKVKTPTETITEKISNADFYCNLNLINAINHAKENKSKVHIIGDYTKDKEVLDAIIKVSKDLSLKNVYLHLYGKKINIKNITAEYNIAKVANVFTMTTDNEKVYEAVVKNKKTSKSKDLNSAHISNNDTVIFYNLDLSNYNELIDALTNKTSNKRELKNLDVLSVFKYNKLNYMYEMDKVYGLSKYISDNNLKQLRVNVDYAFDGYSFNNYKGLKISNENILDVDLSKYDFIVANINSKELKKLENKVNEIGGRLLIVSSNSDNTILASKDLTSYKGNTYSIFSTVIDLLGLKPIKGYAKSLVGKNDNLPEFIFRAVSIVFVIVCVVLYMARFLHFYLTK
nr:hypothetical protein [Bacilli bacterium]